MGDDTMRTYLATVLGLAAATLSAQQPTKRARVPAQGAWGGATKGVGHYADVNGLHLYSETAVTGRRLVLLHGGLGALEMFGPNLAALAKGRQVIAVDLQGHGRTADIDRPLSVALMADDIAALIKHLGLATADVMGYSLGGGVALQTAIRHPEVVRKLVVVSTPFRRNAFYPEILAQQGQVGAASAEAMKQTPMYQLYVSIAPRPDDWPRLLGKIGEAMKQDFDFSKEIGGIKATTLVVAGDADSFPPAPGVELCGRLRGARAGGGWGGPRPRGSRAPRRGERAVQRRRVHVPVRLTGRATRLQCGFLCVDSILDEGASGPVNGKARARRGPQHGRAQHRP